MAAEIELCRQTDPSTKDLLKCWLGAVGLMHSSPEGDSGGVDWFLQQRLAGFGNQLAQAEPIVRVEEAVQLHNLVVVTALLGVDGQTADEHRIPLCGEARHAAGRACQLDYCRQAPLPVALSAGVNRGLQRLKDRCGVDKQDLCAEPADYDVYCSLLIAAKSRAEEAVAVLAELPPNPEVERAVHHWRSELEAIQADVDAAFRGEPEPPTPVPSRLTGPALEKESEAQRAVAVAVAEHRRTEMPALPNGPDKRRLALAIVDLERTARQPPRRPDRKAMQQYVEQLVDAREDVEVLRDRVKETE